MADSVGMISRILHQPTPPPNEDRAKLDARKEALKAKRASYIPSRVLYISTFNRSTEKLQLSLYLHQLENSYLFGTI